MAVFVHLTSHRNLPAIRRSGIAIGKKDGWKSDGVYALPVTRNFNISHQWLRELRRLGGGSIAGVYFRIPDDTPVRVGHYGSLHVEMRAAEAVALMLAAEESDPNAARAADAKSRAVRDRRRLPNSPEGFEVIIPRAIAAGEVMRFRMLPQVIGWRHRPGANGERPCLCVCCEKGSYGATRALRRFEANEAAGRAQAVTMLGRDDRSYRRVERLKAARADRQR